MKPAAVVSTLLGRSRARASRAPRPRPNVDAPPSFACPRCDFILFEEVVYTRCPACDAAVDWVDLRYPVYACALCDAFVNAARDTPPRCAACDRAMDLLPVEEAPRAAREYFRPLDRLRRWADSPQGVGTFLLLSALVLRMFYPVAAAIAGIMFLIYAAKSVWAVAIDRSVRVIHGLEHATCAVLVERGCTILGGQTEKGSFEILVDNEGDTRHDEETVRRALHEAARRIRRGEKELAYHKDCGTTFLIILSIGALAAVGSGSIAAFVLFVFARTRLSLIAQELWTVSTDLRSMKIVRIDRVLRRSGRIARYDVKLRVKLKKKR